MSQLTDADQFTLGNRKADGAMYYVDGYGAVSLDNAVFTMWCAELMDVLLLRVGESTSILFKSGLGESRVRVERLNNKH